MNYVPATHQNARCLQQTSRNRTCINCKSKFENHLCSSHITSNKTTDNNSHTHYFLSRISFLRLDTISFLQRPKNYTHSSRQKTKIHRYPSLRLCSELRLIQDKLCADISLVNVIYTKSATFPSRENSGIMNAFLLNVRSPVRLELRIQPQF